MKIDVIIPSCYPGVRFLELLDRLEAQTCPVNRIIVMNTQKEGLERLIQDEELLKKHPKVLLTHLKREEFDHGRTRDEAVRMSDADVVICMTQDALPANTKLIEKLMGALAQRNVAAAYARQLPEKDCSIMERYTRQFNYPDQSRVKGKEDIPKLGIKTYFCSNVCAAYRREIYEELGGFVSPTIFNEDMIWAARAVKAGYKIAYAAEAEVIHSHNYTAMQQFHRNFDLGVSHAQYPEIFADVPPEGEGMKLVKKTALYLLKNSPGKLPSLFFQSAAKLMGYRLGKSYQKLPIKIVKRCSMQKGYWK
ncbi:MAG: glycosyltransferase family 2 protein [Lachnospiraceae bacterium]|nr:glycosyltransferase family 2 protein [Lachnospiraceae bacterium]